MISAIVPACNEYPQIFFTVQSLLNEGADEVIVIGNKCTDKTTPYFSNLRNPKVKYFVRDDKLSHWQAKNLGIEKSSGDVLFFCDAHCIIQGLQKLANFIKDGMGGVHCVINYMLDPHDLIYAIKPEKFGYSFCSAPKSAEPYKVPVMSTCGMMVSRKVVEELGGWNTELGIYGGGESYLLWKHTTCGYDHWVCPKAHCWHYAEKRGYSWNYNDYVRNTFIAAYCIGGEQWLNQQVEQRKEKDRPNVIDGIADDVRTVCKADRDFIAGKQVKTFDDFVREI
jgi:glycosyltransferase involved in cell wall biosynthesis